MYLEKDYLIKKIDEYCESRGINLTYEQKDILSSQVSRKLDTGRLLSFDEFVELLDHNASIETYSDIDFDDEIVSIEEIGEMDLLDFDVSGNRLFYADGVLTHNSATNNVEDADNSNVSDSMGTAMTADFMLFLLQNEEMKARGEIVAKVTKNRFTGRTDTWMMGIDYEHMRFHDLVVQGSPDTTVFGTASEGQTKDRVDDFGLITAAKQKSAEEFADSEVKSIVREDARKLAEQNNPFNLDDELSKVYAELGI